MPSGMGRNEKHSRNDVAYPSTTSTGSVTAGNSCGMLPLCGDVRATELFIPDGMEAVMLVIEIAERDLNINIKKNQHKVIKEMKESHDRLSIVVLCNWFDISRQAYYQHERALAEEIFHCGLVLIRGDQEHSERSSQNGSAQIAGVTSPIYPTFDSK